MKKILFVINNLKKNMQGGHIAGGGSVVISNLIYELALMSKYQITIITDRDGFCDINNIKVLEIKFEANDKKFLNFVKNEIQENNYDLVLSFLDNNIFCNSFLQCHSIKYKSKNVPIVLRLLKEILSLKKQKQQEKIFKNFNKKYKLFAVSQKIKNDYVDNLKIPDKNVITVYPGVNQREENYEPLRKKDKICFGVVANSSINKGGHFLTFALGILKFQGYDFDFKIIAPKYKKDILLKFLVYIFKLQKNIEVLDKQENMEYFYKSIDCLILPSINEAFGLVVLEAMSYSKPALVSSTAGACEIVNNGKNGFIFNRKSLFDLLENLKNIIKTYKNDFTLYQKISNEAYLTSKKYTWKNFALNVIKSLEDDVSKISNI